MDFGKLPTVQRQYYDRRNRRYEYETTITYGTARAVLAKAGDLEKPCRINSMFPREHAKATFLAALTGADDEPAPVFVIRNILREFGHTL